MAPFLTRPYWNYHAVTSIFDHCNPDYSHDGRICEEDGTVATSANGVDPYFSAGYAVTPGGTNYLYYDGHNGWDIALNYETLLAAADGTVQLAGCDPYNGGCGAGFGLTVTIDHHNGFTTRYGHMSRIDVSPGQNVLRGQVIGVSGNTGASTGPHLHFGVYITSPWTAIDPWGWEGNYPDPWPSDMGNLWITGNPQNPVPWAPQNVSATALSNSASVTWLPPAFDGGSGVDSYVVTSSPGGFTATVPGSQTTAVVAGLTNGTAYTFTVTAANANGTSPASPASNQVVPTATVSIANPAAPSTTDFDVSWSGSNATSYDVTYVEDAGATTRWLTGTTARSAHFDGLGGHSYTFHVTAYASSGNSSATSSPTVVPATATTPYPFKAAYSVDQFGAVHAIGSRPLDSPAIWNWDIGRALTVFANGDGGYILDGWGGVHAFGNAGAPTWSAYWPGWDIARDIVSLPDGSGGYVLDGWGGIHPFAAAGHPMPPNVAWSAYWPGWDIARRLVLNPDGKTGYVLDGWGGLHPFAAVGTAQPPTPAWTGYWPGWDIARGLTLLPGGGGGYVVDGWGGVHEFGSAPPVPLGSYWPLRSAACSISAEALGGGRSGGLVFSAGGGLLVYGAGQAGPAPVPGLGPGARIVAGAAV